MNDAEWNSMKMELEEFFSVSTQDTSAVQGVYAGLAAMGDSNADSRTGAKKALQALLKPFEGSPINRRGSRGNLPTTVAVVLDQLSAELRGAIAGAFDSNPNFRAIVHRHGKAVSNGASPNYDDGAEFGAYIAGKARKAGASLYASGDWDGSLDTLVATITESEVYEEE